jgi:peptidoglycan/LPS O-acetylase OafA/YrhL
MKDIELKPCPFWKKRLFRLIIGYIVTVIGMMAFTPYFMVCGVIEAWQNALLEWKKWNRRADNEREITDK